MKLKTLNELTLSLRVFLLKRKQKNKKYSYIIILKHYNIK